MVLHGKYINQVKFDPASPLRNPRYTTNRLAAMVNDNFISRSVSAAVKYNGAKGHWYVCEA